MVYSGMWLHVFSILAAAPVALVARVPQPSLSWPLHIREDASSYPPSQPVPQLLKDNPDLFYWPVINDTNRVKPLFTSPANQSDGIVNPQDGNWFGTGLFGYDQCKRRGLPKSKIDDAYYDMYYLTNQDGIYEDIDWNSAAAVEFLAPPGNNKDYQERIQKMLLLAAGTSKSWGIPALHHIHVRCDDPARACTKGCNPDGTPIQTDTIAYTSQNDGNGYTSMNFCPRFFNMSRLDDALNYGKGRTYPLNLWLKNYDNTARVFLHELLHADYFMSNSGADHVYDLKMDVRIPGGGSEQVNVYGPLYSKVMARYQPFPPDPLLPKAGWYTSHNADNMAWFATAKYVQDKTEVYPHLPIVYRQIDGEPFVGPNGISLTYSGRVTPEFNITTADKASLLASDTCPNALGSDGKTQAPTVNITGLAGDYAYPADYIKQRNQWITDAQQDSGLPTTTTTASTATTSSTAESTCTGNQVEGDCKTDVLPSAAPYSGPQAPSCAKADGSPGAIPRLNEDAVNTGANEYCDQLAQSKVVLGEHSYNPGPAIFKGQAENGKDMVMTVLFYESACPTDKSASTLDFATYDKQKCVDAFSTILGQACVQDSTWQAYNPGWTVMGGIWANDCALWSTQSQ